WRANLSSALPVASSRAESSSAQTLLGARSAIGPDENTKAPIRTPEPCFRNSLRDGDVGCMDPPLRPRDCTLGLLDRAFQAPRVVCCAIARRYKVERADSSITETPKLTFWGTPSRWCPRHERCQQPVHRAGRFHLHHVSPIGEHLDLHAGRQTGRVRGRDDPILRSPDDERGNVRRGEHVVEEPPLRAAGEEVVRELAERGIDSLEPPVLE